jgi:very-short-patch-repair endonuclease
VPTSPAPSPPPAPIAPERQRRVDTARQAWIRQLVDLSRRNNLLYFRDLKTGTLDLAGASAVALQALLASHRAGADAVELAALVDGQKLDAAALALTAIHQRARSNFEERGLDTLFLALGLASWTAPDGGRDASAPLLLVPLAVTSPGPRGGRWLIRRAGDVKVNDVLVHALRETFTVTIEADAILAAVQGDDEGETFDLQPAFAAVTSAAAVVPGFRVEMRAVIGNFAFQKMAIVKDLQQLAEPLARHAIVAGIAGDRGAADEARGMRGSPDPRTFDSQPPEQEFLIRDADASQQQAIAAAVAGHSGVVSGPPGTGKSQTIANLIAEMVARGKTVLFVAEKRAALDVVLNRLRDAALDHLCLDCHGAELTRRHVAEQLQASLTRIRDTAPVDAARLHEDFSARRRALNAHVAALHQPRQPGGLSVFELYSRLSSVEAGADGPARVSRAALAALDEAAVRAAAERARTVAALAPLVTGTSPSPWLGAAFASVEAMRGAVDAARRLSEERWPALLTARDALLAECPVSAPSTLDAVRSLLATLHAIEGTLETSAPALFTSALDRWRDALEPARSPIRGFLAWCTNGEFRAALAGVRGHHRGPLSRAAALALVDRACTQRDAWQAMVRDRAATPVPLRCLAPLAQAVAAVDHDLRVLAAAFAGRDIERGSLNDVETWLRALTGDLTTPGEVLTVCDARRVLEGAGFTAVWQELARGTMAPALWAIRVTTAWLRSCLDEVLLADPALVAFRGPLHDDVAAAFRRLDVERLAVATRRVQRAHAEAAITARNTWPDENRLVAREAEKRTRHLPLRRLFAEAPHVMLALRPCWMASPLSVSQLMPGDTPLFDLVIFDEASQVLPEDAVTSLLRGRQAVIAGDQRQLPPTTFFAAGPPPDADLADADTETGTEGFQSILDVMSAFLDPPWSLDWHYRSRDERLIAFANHHIYGGRLVTFPGARIASAVSLIEVPHVPGGGGPGASNPNEVTQVVDLVLEHARERPHESLGVITMGIEHANRIEMALVRERQAAPELEAFFGQDRTERFFVKNLERVQGDERDAIILSIGYGRNDAGHVLYRFGPLLQEGGERRLNVAVTRARARMTVVASFGHLDLAPDYPKHGVRLLRAFLEYAASGGARLETGGVTDVPLNPFEQSICDALTQAGLTLARQVGASRYRIDLAAVHPSQPGRYVLAIECDGAAYHAAPTARDRDRLRQQQLEALGWRFHRIWSTDWFLRRDDEIRRTLDAFARAVADADAADASPVPAAPEAAAAPAVSAQPLAPARPRSPQPAIRPGQPIDEYSDRELAALIEWVRSDGRLRTEDEIVTELVQVLGYQRRGSRIVARLTAAIRRGA